jgi:hypothetical protein
MELWEKMEVVEGRVQGSKSKCIAWNRSSGLFVFPSHKIIILILYFDLKIIVNPVRCRNVLLGSLKPSWGQLCIQVDHSNLSPYHETVYGENPPPQITL